MKFEDEVSLEEVEMKFEDEVSLEEVEKTIKKFFRCQNSKIK